MKTPQVEVFRLLEAAEGRRLSDLRVVHAIGTTSGLINNTFAASRIVDFCLAAHRTTSLPYATDVFRSIDHPDAYTWNRVLGGHAAHGSPESGVAWYFSMRKTGGARPNVLTFALLVKACAAAGIGVSREVHGQVIKCGVEDSIVVKNSILRMYCNVGLLGDAQKLFASNEDLDFVSWNTMISGHGKNGDVVRARELFDRMPQRNLITWSAMIDGYVAAGEFSVALRLFRKMERSARISPDAVTLASVLKCCANLGALDEGRRIHLRVIPNILGRELNVVLATALVDMYCKCGCLDDALEVFDGVPDGGDVVLWNSMIGGLAVNGRGDKALEIFRRMDMEGPPPNAATFLGALRACVHAGIIDVGIRTFETMKERGFEHRRDHYGCLADLLSRAGRLREAEAVLLGMQEEAEASQWGALMAACCTHKNIDVGERVGRRLVELEPLVGGRYIQLANLYAAVGRSEDAMEIRAAMEAMAVNKTTGFSSSVTENIRTQL